MKAALDTQGDAELLVAELRHLGARFNVLPIVHGGSERWTSRTSANLEAVRQRLKMAATFRGGWQSSWDMAPGKPVSFVDPAFNRAFRPAIRQAGERAARR